MTLQTSIIPKNKTDRHLTNRDILADHRLTDRDILANHHLTDKDILADHSLTNKDILTSHHLANRDTQIPQKELVNIGDVQPSVKITTIAVIITTTRTVATLETDTKISQMRDTDINQNLQIIIGLNHLGDLHQNLLTGLDLLIITHTVIGQIHLIVHKISTNVDAGRAIVLDTYSGTAGLAGIPLEMVTATDAVLVLIIKVVETPIVLLTRLPLTCLLL